MHLLLVEDDDSLRATLERSLGRVGMRVTPCADGALALPLWRSDPPDVVVLDLSLPHVDGLQVLQQARSAGLRTPVLLLTARGTVGDKVAGLNAGADDYLPKPFDLDELEARIRALHRRHQGPGADAPADLQVGALRYDRSSGAMYLGHAVFDLTQREIALLRALMARSGKAVTKEQLFEQVFPGELDVQYDAIEVVVYRLRKKLGPTGLSLVTLRGLGYLLKVDAA
ncbi:response regulator transcription factor [Curvibacter sp. APW13]|uniref:response regulator transcription factor n=1 Tax=Curvibacter sp. APW13 TaxID=3077236 RepID=UPI0028DDB19D|nr:response regulator transcription factor [Curvibacter sp. APW13]MDT8991431.1 response regulator transcription factor [Curvibacter sp. APW13]